MQLPEPRGRLSSEVLRLVTAGSTDSHDSRACTDALRRVDDPLHDGDFQLALACCYELHYRGFDGGRVSPRSEELEWDPVLLTLRAQLERRFEAELKDRFPVPTPPGATVDEQLRALVAADAGTNLSRFLLREATVSQFRDFLVQRSVYQLKEADPHTWQIPRLSGRAKDALVEIQSDEYGGGRRGGAHATLFARTLRALDLDDTYGAWWDEALPQTFAAVNLMSLLGLHRRHRGAALGHLAALEMTSTGPNGRYGNGLRRLGFGKHATEYFDEHVEADAVHEQIATVDMCGSFVHAEPARHADVLWGAAALLGVDTLASTALLQSWSPTAHEGVA